MHPPGSWRVGVRAGMEPGRLFVRASQEEVVGRRAAVGGDPAHALRRWRFDQGHRQADAGRASEFAQRAWANHRARPGCIQCADLASCVCLRPVMRCPAPPSMRPSRLTSMWISSPAWRRSYVPLVCGRAQVLSSPLLGRCDADQHVIVSEHSKYRLMMLSAPRRPPRKEPLPRNELEAAIGGGPLRVPERARRAAAARSARRVR